MRSLISFAFIIIAGEAIFFLPFVIPRLFRPLLLDAWSISNTDLGLAFSAYGISAMASYVLGGPLADRFGPRILIASSLILTVLGGIPLMLIPGRTTLVLTYFGFGVSTILLMWSAMLRSTHRFGGDKARATAMGALDGGRGLTAAVTASLLVWILSHWTGEGTHLTSTQSVYVIYGFVSLIIVLVAIGIWLSLESGEFSNNPSHRLELQSVVQLFSKSEIWLLGLIVLCSYCGYKSIDYYTSLLVDVHKSTLVEASSMTSFVFWARPISALSFGVLADRSHNITGKGRLYIMTLLLSAACLANLGIAYGQVNTTLMVLTILSIAAAIAYALRAIYFSVLAEIDIPEAYVGTTVGLISLVGFLPDVFFGALTGQWIDLYPGQTGYRYVFLFTAFSLAIGASAAMVVSIKARSQRK